MSALPPAVVPAAEVTVTPAVVEKIETPAQVVKQDSGSSKESLEALRAENAASKSLAAEYQAKLKSYETAQAAVEAKAAEARGEFQKLYEAEKTQRAADMARVNVRLVDSELKARAAAAGMVDPSDALALIDRSKITLSDSGEVSDTTAMLAELKTKKPYLFAGDTATVTKRGTPAPVVTSQNTDTSVNAFKMSSSDFKNAWASLGQKS
jgi:hypothetical protein